MIALPYLLLETFYIILALFEQSSIRMNNKKYRIRVACCVSFLLFFGFRGFVGWDFSAYYPLFMECQGISSALKGEMEMEPGFCLYMAILKSIWGNYHFYIFVSVLIDVVILNVVIKRYGLNYALCFVIYVAMMGMFEIDLQRNAKSFLLFLLSIRYIQNRRFRPFLLLNLVGLSFHLSSILYFPCYFFLNVSLRKRTLIGILLILEVLYLTQSAALLSSLAFIAGKIGGIYGELIAKYFENTNFAVSKGLSIGQIERTITFCLIILNYSTLKRDKPYNVIFINSFILFFTIQVLFNGIAVIADRLSTLFVFSYLVVWPAILRCYDAQKAKRDLWLVFICLYSLLRINGYYSGRFFKYDNVLFGIDSFDKRYQVFRDYSMDILEENLNNSK